MSKEIKIQSKSLKLLNETIQKAINFGTKVIKSPLKENDKFSSVLSTDNSFDSEILKNDDLEINELTPKQKEEKTKLTNEVLDKLNDTLKTNKEIYNLLNKIRDINKTTDTNKWVRNKEKNTACLQSKNAKIFMQNNNICLSHDGKIEIFKSVNELHDWLIKNNYPLPHDIKLHEAREKLNEFKILNNKGFAQMLMGNDLIDPLKNYKSSDYKKPEANVDAWYLSYPVEEKGKIIYDSDNNPVNYTGKKLYLRNDWKRYKAFEDLLTSDINEAYQFYSKAQTKGLQTLLFTKYFETLLPVKPVDDLNTLYYLKYIGQDYTGSSTVPEYLYKDYKTTGQLFTSDINQAKLFGNKVQASAELNEIKAKYPKLEYKFKIVSSNDEDLNECTTAGLGSAVSWLASSKKKVNEEALEEAEGKIFGFEETPFSNTLYNSKAERASAYLNWIFNSYNGVYQIDPNYEDNVRTAMDDFTAKSMRSRGNELWAGVQKSRYRSEFPLFSGITPDENKPGYMADTPENHKIVQDVNQRYGLTLNPDEPLGIFREPKDPENPKKLRKMLISQHNKDQRDYFINNIFKKAYKPGDMAKSIDLKQYKFNKNLTNDNIADTLFKLKNTYLTAVNNPEMYNKDKTEDKVINYLTKLINGYKNTLKNKEIYNPVIDKFIQANNEFPKNAELDQSILDRLKALKDSKKQKEQALKEDDSPADFATGTNASDPVASNEISSNSDTSDVNLNNMIPETNDIPSEPSTTGFDDININTGDYAPDDTNEEEPAQPEEEFKIIDILVNNDNSEQIKVKLKNVATDEIIIKDLSEIDF